MTPTPTSPASDAPAEDARATPVATDAQVAELAAWVDSMRRACGPGSLWPRMVGPVLARLAAFESLAAAMSRCDVGGFRADCHALRRAVAGGSAGE